MSKWIGGMLVLSSLGLFFLAGCDNEQVGGPGADVRTDEDQEPQAEEATFTASLEEEEIELPVGEKKEFTISIDRGEQFEQTVTAKFEPPQGVTVTPEVVQYQAGQEEGKIFLQTSQADLIGKELAIGVTFEPETGRSITKQLTVTIVEAEQGEQTQDEEGEEPAVEVEEPAVEGEGPIETEPVENP